MTASSYRDGLGGTGGDACQVTCRHSAFGNGDGGQRVDGSSNRGVRPCVRLDVLIGKMRPTSGRGATGGTSDRGGFALILVLVALLVLGSIVSAAVAAALAQMHAANTAGQVLAGRVTARAGLDLALAGTRGLTTATVGGGQVELVAEEDGALPWRVLDLRLSPELHLLISETTAAGGAQIREGRLVWWIDPETRVVSHRAVIESTTATFAPTAHVNADSLLSGRTNITDCGEAAGPLAGAFSGVTMPANGSLPAPPEWGSAEGSGSSGFEGLRLGWLSGPNLAENAELTLDASGVNRLHCPTCWAGVVSGRGSVTLADSGVGLLAVEGNLELLAGGSWSGLILASGDVTLGDSATVTGFIRAGGAVQLSAGATVNGSACAVLESIRNATSLARPVPLPWRSKAGPIAPGQG